MSDQRDLQRFDRVTTLFRDELQKAGLTPKTKEPTETAAGDGWYTTVATWSRLRPSVSVFFDTWLDSREGASRHFWFGFNGSKEHIGKLVKEIEHSFPAPIVWPSGFKRLRGSDKSKVEKNGGFVYEKYRNDDHYLGMYDVGFSRDSDSWLVGQAAAFIIEIIDVAEGADISELGNVKPTERLALILARRGQGLFRDKLEKIWDARCAVTKCSIREVLRASHIKPWRNSNNDERRSPAPGPHPRQ
jgi:hypothetical protein